MTKFDTTPTTPTPVAPTTPAAALAEQERVLALLEVVEREIEQAEAACTDERHQSDWDFAQGQRDILERIKPDLATHAALLAAHAEALEREVRLRAIHQEKAKRLGSLRRYAWEQYRRRVPEMRDVGRDLDFITAMPLYHPETGAVVTVDESLETARQTLTPPAPASAEGGEG